MTAIEQLTKMNEDYHAELLLVRAEYSGLALASRLAERHGLASVEDAFEQEAKQRCRRDKWAKATSKA